MFCVYAQTVPDSLHLADTGLWQAIIVAVLEDCKKRLFEAIYPAGSIRDKKWEAAMDRLQIRLSRWTHLENHRLASWVTKVGSKIDRASETSSPIFSAGEYRQLMLVSHIMRRIICPK